MVISIESPYFPYEVQLGLDGRGEDGDLLMGDMIDPYEELNMESGSLRRRSLAGRSYISHDAPSKNNVPCNRRGHSYYNCQRSGRANP
ncbi:hypothetical protein DCAR_0832797 [Daucus carota subsp. sativus]|uniref:Uncharacterized protein n=2 Tax=Daucus carota subsp. sativus TaxID=79200 RepID=A0AAF0XSB7_DAUCS|nr:hypothetical protein DCAR_0832797 [Daucus carota subsp. sativus]